MKKGNFKKDENLSYFYINGGAFSLKSQEKNK